MEKTSQEQRKDLVVDLPADAKIQKDELREVFADIVEVGCDIYCILEMIYTMEKQEFEHVKYWKLQENVLKQWEIRFVL